MSLLRALEAPPISYWNSNPYTVQFSPDGSRLAIGSGGAYGGGGITLVDLATWRERTIRFVVGDPPPPDDAPWAWGDQPLTASGLAFDGSGAHLAVAAWASRHRHAPAFLCRVDGLALEHVETYVWEETWRTSSCPTGACFSNGRLHLRCNARKIEGVIRSFDVPDAVDARPEHAHRSHARIAAIGQQLITGGGGSLKLGGWSRDEGMYEAHKATSGLVAGPAPLRAVRVDGPRITAVLATSSGGLLTGGLDGTIRRWEQREGAWIAGEVVAPGVPKPPPVESAWATYRPESVVGLCRLDGDGRWFSVDAAGEIVAWQGADRRGRFDLPRPGTARSIAVHPATPHGPSLAVAVKAGDADRRGYVAIYRL